MAAPHSLRLKRVFGPSLSNAKKWYAVSTEWLSRPKLDTVASTVAPFSEEIAVVSIYDLVDCNGAKVDASCFGSARKKDLVVVSTLFGILTRALRGKSTKENRVIASLEFSAIRDVVNSLPITAMAGRSEIPANLPETPPSSPEDMNPEVKAGCSIGTNVAPGRDLAKPFEDLKKLEKTELGPRLKVKRTGAVASECLAVLEEEIAPCPSTLGKAFGYGLLHCSKENQSYVEDVISTAVETVAEKQGIKKAFGSIVSEDLSKRHLESLRVPHWVQLYVKLATKLPNRSWQTLLNFLNIGTSKKSTDVGILLSANNIRAQKDLVSSVTRKVFELEPLVEDLRGHGISLKMALIWQIRQSRLHQDLSKIDVLEFNLKLDGRPLAGRPQVSVGVVPMLKAAGLGKSPQSSLAVLPIAIANCDESKEDIKMLIVRVNEEKKAIKKLGLTVDGRHYTIKFKVTLDLKALYLLLEKIGDKNFKLGIHGVEIEFCFLCDALRACKEHWGGSFDEVCLTCLQSKANIGKWSGIRDDLTFLLDEELTNVTLCALHSEMRNTEQLLGSLGLFAYRCKTLDDCNEALKDYGPELSRGHNRINVKLRKGQQTAVDKNNISVASFSGSTERSILANIQDIINKTLPPNKVANYYKEVEGASRDVVLGFVTFTNQVKKYVEEIIQSGQYERDYGKPQKEVIKLDEAKDLKKFLENEKEVWSRKLEEIEQKFLSCEQSAVQQAPSAPSGPPPKKKRKRKGDEKIDQKTEEPSEMTKLAASLQISHFHQVFQEWIEIAKVTRSSEFEESEDQEIDIYEIQCKLWGFLLRHLFGVTLGMGDYGHLTIEHSAMLLRLHRTFAKYANQGFEGSHKVHRAIYSRATNHDQGGVGSSVDQIMIHWLCEMMLFLRYLFLKALECITAGTVWPS
ncbi:uncharacterized protein LOC144663391 isoform X2 [Oculina patagonica]